MSLPKLHIPSIKKRPDIWAYIVGTLILLVSVWFWWTQVYLSPSRVFWGMLDTSLSTRSASVENTQMNGQTSARQLTQFELGTTNKAHSYTTLTQAGGTIIKTEIIGTPKTDYIRYRSIETDQKNAEGKDLNFKGIVGVWTKSADTKQSATQSSGQQLFAQAVLGIGLPVGSVPVPVGELKPQDRDDLLRLIRSERVYETSFKDKDVKKETKNGRTTYTYKVKIQTILYVRIMKTFAQKLGLHELDQVDPNQYQTSAPLEVELVVDAHSRQLVMVRQPATGVVQTYKGYGVPLKVSIPMSTIPPAELQERLNSL